MKPITVTIRVDKQFKQDLQQHVKRLSKQVGYPVSISIFLRDLIAKSLKS